MKKLVLILISLAMVGLAFASPSIAATKNKTPVAVEIKIDISSQSMAVNVKGWPYGRWKISTAREGYYTPVGSWRPFLLKKMHYSRKYDNSPMPHSIFFLGGYAIHGTDYLKSLGRPASHGCIRLHPKNAARLFSLVKKYGNRATRITITQ